MTWAIFWFVVVLHLVAFGFVVAYLHHNQSVSAKAPMGSETVKQAEANIEKVVTGIVAYIVGTVGGYIFKTKS